MKNDKIILGIAVFAVLAAIVAVMPSALASASMPTISVEPSYLKVTPGETFTVNISVDPIGTEIYGAQYTLYFDNSLLNATSQTKGPFLGDGTLEVTNEINNMLGGINYSETRKLPVTTGVTEPGVLATIIFDAIAEHGGISELRLDEVILSDPNATQIQNVAVNNGNVEISGSSYNFNGFPVETRTNGTVHGGVFIDYVPGAEDTQTGSFDVPNGNIKWAYLYTGIWGGTENYEGWVNVTFNGDYTSNNLGPIWLRGKNDTNPNVWCSGHGKHWMYYNVTTLTNAGSTNSATVSKINATDPGGNFDGDPYGIVLVVVYEGGDNPKHLRYWINVGSDALNYVYSHNAGTTYFNGTVDTANVTDANLTMVHLTAYDPPVSNGLKFNGNPLDTSMINTNAFDLHSWDVTSYIESSGNDAWYTRCGDYPTCNVLHSDGYVNICNAILVLDETQPQPAQPDLNVTAIAVNPDHDAGHRELFANESNTIIATITNLDSNNNSKAFNVSFEVEGVNTWKVPVSGLAAGASTDVTINWTPTSGGTLLSPVNYNLNVTADCDGEVSETDETNNASTKALTVYNNGYKGKRYTGGSDIETEQKETINGNLVYSKGDTAYQTGGSWSSYTGHWTSADLPIPGSATVKKARLYVYYNWDSSAAGINASLNFNGHLFSMNDLDAHYKDTKGYGMYYNHKSGTMAYDVTSDFDTAGNTATLTKVVPNNIVAIYGMLLVVVYEDASEPQRLIWINEECDILDALGEGSSTTGYIGVNETEATAYAPFSGTIDISKVEAAKLITVVPAGDSGPGNEDRLYFNSGQWDNVWNGASGENISIYETDANGYLQSGSNLARMQSRGDYITATNAFLVVEYKVEAVPSVVINEFLANPSAGNDWVELYNPTSTAVDLTGWTLNDSASQMKSLSGSISADGYLIADVGTRLNANSDSIILLKNGIVVDQVTYGAGADNAPVPSTDKSTGRYPNGVDTDNDNADFRVFDTPTPGAQNTIPAIPPEIVAFAPPTPVSNNEGEPRTFNITIDQTVNVSWLINGTGVQTNESVTEASYTNDSAVIGTWNVSAVVENANGCDMQSWIWRVSEPGVAPTADYLEIEDASGGSGTYVEVPVSITNVSNGPVQGIRLRVDYNESVLNLTNIGKGDLTSAWTDLQLGEDRHTMVIATANTGDAIPDGSSGSVVLLNFHVIGSPGDTSPMNMTLIELANPDGEVGTAPARNGTFVVSKLGAIVGRITYACNGTGIAGVNVNLTAGSIVNTTVTNETGYYNFTDVIPDSYVVNASKLGFHDNSTEVTVIAGETTTADMTLWLKGDLNNDGSIADAGDVVLMLSASVGDISGDTRYDLNGNGNIADAGDVVLMLSASVGDIELL